MALLLFGVTPTKVRNHHFPQLSAFTASTTPTSDTVQEMIDSEAAELGGRIRAEGGDPASITSGSTPAAYAWCADTIRIGAAARAMRSMPGATPAAVDALIAEVNERYKELDQLGLAVLGDVATAGEANASRSYFTTGTADASTMTRFRKDDEL